LLRDWRAVEGRRGRKVESSHHLSRCWESCKR
jgi:hypothetical protein